MASVNGVHILHPVRTSMHLILKSTRPRRHGHAVKVGNYSEACFSQTTYAAVPNFSFLAPELWISLNFTGPPEGVGLGGNSGPASSLYMTFFRWLVVVSSITASPASYGFCGPVHRNDSGQPCRRVNGLGWCIADWLPSMAKTAISGMTRLIDYRLGR
jgi:hypothetical protein